MALTCDSCGNAITDRARAIRDGDQVAGRDLCLECADQPCAFCGQSCDHRHPSEWERAGKHRWHKGCAAIILRRAAERGDRVPTDLQAFVSSLPKEVPA